VGHPVSDLIAICPLVAEMKNGTDWRTCPHNYESILWIAWKKKKKEDI